MAQHGQMFYRRGNNNVPEYVHEFNPYLLPETDED